MYYKEWLRVRRGVVVIVIIAVVLLALHFILLPFMDHPGGTVGTQTKPDDLIPLVAVLCDRRGGGGHLWRYLRWKPVRRK